MAIAKAVFFGLIITTALQAFAQEETEGGPAVVYEVIYDEPFAVNKLFLHFQPLYGELFVTNVNVGFGFEANYFLRDKADFTASLRKTYSAGFFDQVRDQALKTSDMDNDPRVLNYYELGGTYHIKDFEMSSRSKIVLYSDSLKGNKWAAQVPLDAVIPCKVRKVLGARLGGLFWDSSVDLNRVLESQDLAPADLVDDEGNTLSSDLNIFSDIVSAGLYAGGSMTWIKNVGVTFDKYDDRVDDMILTTYLDLIFAPSVELDDVVYTERDTNGAILNTSTYNTDIITIKKVGFRAGVTGKFNRTMGWAYGIEAGYRPGIESNTFFALVKISIPVFSSSLEYEVESFEGN